MYIKKIYYLHNCWPFKPCNPFRIRYIPLSSLKSDFYARSSLNLVNSDICDFEEKRFGGEGTASGRVLPMSGGATKLVLQTLDGLAKVLGRADQRPEAHQTGARGEEAAYFYLREQGYTIVARNYRSPRRKGELDLVGWTKDSAGDILSFIEVKTRSARGIATAEQSVDFDKQRELRAMAADYLRKLKQQPRYRFDVVSVYSGSGTADITLFKDAFPLA